MLAHEAGYIDRDNEVIVGLQTDKPFKRAIFPQIIAKVFFMGPKSFATQYRQDFRPTHPELLQEFEIPRPMLALACLAVCSTLSL